MPPATGHNIYRLPELRDALRPIRLRYYPRLCSTSDQAATLRRRGDLFAPAAILTARQTAGRGRGGNQWIAPPGTLTVTFAFPVDDHLAGHQIPLLAGLAIRQAVEDILRAQSPATAALAPEHILLKWPNDLLHEDRKLAGLLCERLAKVDLIGIGLNVNTVPSALPAALRKKTTSLRTITGQPLDITRVLITLASHLRTMFTVRDETTFSTALRDYDQHHALIGRTVTIVAEADQPAITGRCEGLDSIGRLLVRSPSKLHHIIAGTVVAR